MTVNSTIAKVTSNGNGAATRFPSSPVKFFREQDVSVTIVDTNGDETPVSLGTGPNAFAVDGDFTTTNDTLVEADIIYPADEVTPLPSGWKIVIKREIPFTQTAIDLQNQGGYFPETQEKGFDLAMIGLIQLQEEVDRSVKVKIGSTVSTDQLSEDIQNVAASLSDVTAVATDLTGTDTVGTVATNIADVNTTATNITNVNTTATNIADVNTTATNIANVNTVATDLNLGASSLVKIVADDLSGTDTVGTVVTNIADVNTTATNITNVTTVATDITNVNTVATNITGVNSFAERYRVSTTNPSTSLDEGDLVFNTTDKVLRYYDGAVWNSILPGITAVADDTTPQLGGNLDAQNNKITSLADPTAAQDASTKTYVDGITGRTNTWTGANTFSGGITLNAGEIDTADLGDDAVTTVKLADDAVTADKMNNVAYNKNFLHIQDQKPSGTDGGSSVAGANTRDLNTVLKNTITGASLSANKITLPAGTYYITARAQCGRGSRNQLRVYNATDSSYIVDGLSSFADDTNNQFNYAEIPLSEFTLASTKDIELRHIIQLARADSGLGLAVGPQIPIDHETFSDVKIWKVS